MSLFRAFIYIYDIIQLFYQVPKQEYSTEEI